MTFIFALPGGYSPVRKVTFCALNERINASFGPKDALCQNTSGMSSWLSKHSSPPVPLPTVSDRTTSMGDRGASAGATVKRWTHINSAPNRINRGIIGAAPGLWRRARTVHGGRTASDCRRERNNKAAITPVQLKPYERRATGPDDDRAPAVGNYRFSIPRRT